MSDERKKMVGDHPASPFGRTEAYADDDYWEQKAKIAQVEVARLTAALTAATARAERAEAGLRTFLDAWGTIHESPDWADPTITRYSPHAVGIFVDVALQARAILAPSTQAGGAEESDDGQV